MSRIEELISKLCPSGVPFRPLGELLKYEQPGSYLVESTAYDDSYPTPVLTAGQTFILGYTEETTGIYEASPDCPVVIFDDFTTAFKWVDFPFKAKSSAMKMLTPNSDALIDFRFVYFVMHTITYRPQDHARQWIGTYSQFRVPVPPLEVQQEIVRILNLFTSLEAELDAELEARRVQNIHYRTRILDEAWQGADSIALGQLGRIVTGRTPKASDASAWGSGIDFVTPSDIRSDMRTISTPARRLSEIGAAAMAKSLVPAGSLLVTCIGADMGKTVVNANECVTNQQINSIVPKMGVDVGYLFHVLRSMRDRLRTQGERGGGTMPIINKSDFSRIEVVVPSINVQRIVASKLDQFDVFVNDLNTGLPAELHARRHQYEYYRDKLLKFEEVVA